jgi:hypothetical protein
MLSGTNKKRTPGAAERSSARIYCHDNIVSCVRVSHEEAAAAIASSLERQPGSARRLFDYAPLATPSPIAGPGATMGRARVPGAEPATDASLGYPDHAVVSMTMDELKKAPALH